MRPSRRTKAELTSENEQLRAQLATLPRLIDNLKSQLAATRATQPPPTFIAIKSIDAHGYGIDTLKRWADRGQIDSRREGSRWFATQASVTARVNRLRGR
jgi:hypothetical protein